MKDEDLLILESRSRFSSDSRLRGSSGIETIADISLSGGLRRIFRRDTRWDRAAIVMRLVPLLVGDEREVNGKTVIWEGEIGIEKRL